jgi:hypothetical protein
VKESITPGYWELYNDLNGGGDDDDDDFSVLMALAGFVLLY